MKPIKRLQLGKNGLSHEFIGQVRKVFEDEQILKISILKSACRNKKDAEKIGEDLVDALGKNYIYRLVGYVLTINKFKRAIR
ncbi:MAG: YhbY family RNA-binding protein [Candidatus Pacearchaeota archaeon]